MRQPGRAEREAKERALGCAARGRRTRRRTRSTCARSGEAEGAAGTSAQRAARWAPQGSEKRGSHSRCVRHRSAACIARGTSMRLRNARAAGRAPRRGRRSSGRAGQAAGRARGGRLARRIAHLGRKATSVHAQLLVVLAAVPAARTARLRRLTQRRSECARAFCAAALRSRLPAALRGQPRTPSSPSWWPDSRSERRGGLKAEIFSFSAPGRAARFCGLTHRSQS